MRKLILLPAVAILATGCAAADQFVDTAIDRKRQQSDTEARAVINVPCVITVGAYYRELTPREQQAIDVLCGGDSGQRLVE